MTSTILFILFDKGKKQGSESSRNWSCAGGEGWAEVKAKENKAKIFQNPKPSPDFRHVSCSIMLICLM